MKIKVSNEVDFSLEILAEVLWDSTPEDFAEFWFKFSELANDSKVRITTEEKLHEFAEAMSCNLGANRKLIFARLQKLISYYEVKNSEQINCY